MTPPKPRPISTVKNSKPAATKSVKPGRSNQVTTPDPLAGVPQTESLETDAAAEFDALAAAYRDRASKEAARRRAATDSEFWFAVCFTSREEKETFLKAVGLIGRSAPDKYIPGELLAKKLGIRY